MKIILTRGAKKYLKRRMDYDEKLIISELNSLLSPYNDKVPKNFKVIVKADDIPNGQFVSFNAVSITSRHVLNYFKTHAKLFMGSRIIETIGHEIGHGKAFAGIPLFFISKSLNKRFATKKDIFRHRLVESFCDNYSVNFTDLSREEHSYILKEHIFEDANHKTDFMHPSWEERSKYVLKPFDENLIREIAKDNDFTDEKEILKQIEYYEKVVENDGYIRISSILKAAFSSLFSIILIFSMLIIIYLIFNKV